MIAIALKTDQKKNPIGIEDNRPVFSWKCEGGIHQSAFQIICSQSLTSVVKAEGEKDVTDRVLWDSGIVKSDETSVLAGISFEKRAKVCWKVMLWDENDNPGVWSTQATFELGIGDRSAFEGQWIAPEITKQTAENYDCKDAINALAKDAWDERKHKKDEVFKPHQPASYLHRKFEVNLPCDVEHKNYARLYITAHGLYEAYLNGKRIGNYVLMPGCNNYEFEVAYQTYDVTELLQEGENELLVVLGDGWYRSTSGVDGDRNLFGDTLALLCQLEINGKSVICSDSKWKATQEGPLRQNDMQQGEVYDARREETLHCFEKTDKAADIWHEVRILPDGREKLIAMDALPIKEQETFEGKLITTSKGETVIDFGQNMAGYVEFWIEGKDGEEIRLLHGETIDADGNFTQENFEDRKRHKENGTYQMISYICKGGTNHYKPRFTIMGFRYVKVETKLDLSKARFVSHAVYSDMEQTAEFECDNADVNQLFLNSVWSQKGNFCDIPTDCPTRERAGWTGDAGLFVGTGLTLMDSQQVFVKWLSQCRYGQYADGRISNIAPPNKKAGFMTGLLSGSVAWGDASVLVPYEMYRRSGDVRILRENYQMMKKWFVFLEKRAGKVGIKHIFEKNPYKKYTLNSGLNYGEWCEPGTNSAQMMRDGNYDVATAYFSHSGKLLSEIAEILGEKQDAEHFSKVAQKAKEAFRYSYTKDGVIESERQCQYIRPIQFGLLSIEECKVAAKQLNELVVKNEYHLNTGFLTTPFLCETLAEYGYVETAYRVLLQDTAPGWLYEVKNGATTIWETWEGDASLNHYSYGAISGWLISGVCGIKYQHEKIEIKPTPYPLLKYAKANYDSPAGKIVSEWKYVENIWKLRVEIPVNATAEIYLPNGAIEQVGAGKYDYEILIL